MTDPQRGREAAESDAEVERLLGEALGVSGLAPERLNRVRAAAETEWRTVTAALAEQTAHRARPRWTSYAVAASLAAVAVAVWIGGSVRPAAPVGSFARVNPTGVEVRAGIFRHRAAGVGDVLRVGDRLATAGPLLIAFVQGGTMRVAAESRLTMTAASEVSLDRGTIYLDFPPVATRRNPMHVKTRAGVIEHLGTEFEVHSDERNVRIRVREGRIRLVGTTDSVEAGSGTELLAEPGVPVTRRPVKTYGQDWAWTSEIAPEFAIEGSRLIDFLNWASRESGRHLDIIDAPARLVADRTVLHGSVRGQAPDAALTSVLATTSLEGTVQADAIVIKTAPR
jgi:FecR protein